MGPGRLENTLKNLQEGKKTRSATGPCTLAEITDLLINLRDDINDKINEMKQAVNEVRAENEQIKTALTTLKSETKNQLDIQAAKIRILEQKLEKETAVKMENTLFIKGLHPNPQNKEDYKTIVNRFLKNALQLNMTLDSIQTIKTTSSGPNVVQSIMIKTKSKADKISILKNCHLLKNTGVKITPWMTKEEQTINNHVLMKRREFIGEGKKVKIAKKKFLIVTNTTNGDETIFESDGICIKKVPAIPNNNFQ